MTSIADGGRARRAGRIRLPLKRLFEAMAALLERWRRPRIDHLDDRTLADIGLDRPAAPPRRYPDRLV